MSTDAEGRIICGTDPLGRTVYARDLPEGRRWELEDGTEWPDHIITRKDVE